MEPISVAGALTAASQISTLLKGLVGAVKESGKTEIISKVIDLQTSMMDLIQKHHELIDENHALQREVGELKEQIETTGKIRFFYDIYWIEREDKSLDGPYSPKVWDLERKLLRMHLRQKTTADGEAYYQFVCLNSEKYASVPVKFCVKNRIWTEEEFACRGQ